MGRGSRRVRRWVCAFSVAQVSPTRTRRRGCRRLARPISSGRLESQATSTGTRDGGDKCGGSDESTTRQVRRLGQVRRLETLRPEQLGSGDGLGRCARLLASRATPRRPWWRRPVGCASGPTVCGLPRWRHLRHSTRWLKPPAAAKNLPSVMRRASRRQEIIGRENTPGDARSVLVGTYLVRARARAWVRVKGAMRRAGE